MENKLEWVLGLIQDAVRDRQRDNERNARAFAQQEDARMVEIKRACATEDRLIRNIIDRIRKDYGV